MSPFYSADNIFTTEYVSGSSDDDSRWDNFNSSDDEDIFGEEEDDDNDFYDLTPFDNYGKYRIGKYIELPIYPYRLLLGSYIKSKTFFEYDIDKTNMFLNAMVLPNRFVLSPKIDILQTYIENIDGFDTTLVILKTYWLRIVQRHWSKIYKERQEAIEQMKNPINLRMRDISGSFSNEILMKNRQGLKGMLAIYKNPIKT